MKVYKYRGGGDDALRRSLRMLAENTFWAAKASSLNDPAEAYVDDQPLRTTLGVPGAAEVLGAFDVLTRMKDTVGVYSLSRTPADELMWAYYGAGHTGFCIEYDLERLRLEARTDWNVVDVAYRDQPQAIQLADILMRGDPITVVSKMIGTKSSRWAHEQELRIITTSSGLKYHAAQAVTGLYFGCRCTDDFIVEAQVSLKGRPIRFFQMAFSSKSYAMTTEELPALPAGDPGWLAPVEDDAVPEISLISERDRPYHLYLERAVDRVRRDPSCMKVLLADFSGNQRQANGPVVFVQYETNVPTQFNNTVNRYFRIDELEQ